MSILQTPFPVGWQHYLLGGLCLGAGVALLFLFTGRIGSMSTVFSSTWSYVVRRPFFQQARLVDTRGWRLLYALGLILGALAWWLWRGAGVAEGTQVPWWLLLAGGFVAGYGARLGNGCTSGHGICGLARLSPRLRACWYRPPAHGRAPEAPSAPAQRRDRAASAPCRRHCTAPA